jgi:hypothetical protein
MSYSKYKQIVSGIRSLAAAKTWLENKGFLVIMPDEASLYCNCLIDEEIEDGKED